MKTPLEIVFIGCKDIGFLCLSELCKAKIAPTYFVTLKSLFEPRLRALCRTHNIKPILFENFHREEKAVFQKIGSKNRVLVGCAFPYILKEESLKNFKHAVNVHTGLLPRYRGFHPIAAALRNDEPVQGTTIHLMRKAVDAGEIVDQQSIPVLNEDTMVTIKKKLNLASALLLVKTLKNLRKTGKLKTRQQKGKVVIAPKYTEKDSRLDFKKLTAREAHNLIRCLVDPYPNAFAFDAKGKKISFKGSIASNKPGTVLAKAGKDQYVIATTDGVVLVKTKDTLKIGDVIR